MLDQVLEAFNIVPNFDLNIMKENPSLTEITVNVLEGLSTLLQKEKSHLVLVHGDTTTTLVASLAAFYNQIPIGHIEAGLRRWNKKSPFPEEVNRQLTGILADLHFAPTETAMKTLIAEGKNKKISLLQGTPLLMHYIRQ